MEGNLPIVEYFHSIQGEGAHAGRSAFFIRLASCKVGCPWCDTKESWSTNNHKKESIASLCKYITRAENEGAAFVVITGGEPLHHNLNSLCNNIREKNSTKAMSIHLETSGVDPLTGNPDWITLSPKRHAPPLKELLHACHELKVVIHTKEDLIFAEKMANIALQNNQNNPILFLQAGWNSRTGQNLTYDYVKRNPQWRLSMQTHKWLGIR